MNLIKTFFVAVLFFNINNYINAQTENQKKDSLYIQEIENPKLITKILHAEPLYIDLIRDLGARKGEKEWNVGFGLTDANTFDKYSALVEYEWAPIDRLGLEVELPFTFYYPLSSDMRAPNSSLEGIKLAAQYTFLVSEKKKTSLALGYIHEFKTTSFKTIQENTFFNGNLFNPFLVAAKRWGDNFHSLIYTGPVIVNNFHKPNSQVSYQINSNIHYMITGTRNFVGIEFNKELNEKKDFDMTIRPQMRVGIADNIMVGIVTGIPVNRETERFSSFLRLIYEPKHVNKH